MFYSTTVEHSYYTYRYTKWLQNLERVEVIEKGGIYRRFYSRYWI